MNVHRGYVKTKNKKCVEKFKDRTDLMTLEQARRLDEFAGILAEDIVLVDFDDETHAKIALDIVREEKLNCIAISTTRGLHLYFKSNRHTQTCRTHASLACGLKADIKLGSRNSYAICKFNGVEREVIYRSDIIDEIPNFFNKILARNFTTRGQRDETNALRHIQRNVIPRRKSN